MKTLRILMTCAVLLMGTGAGAAARTITAVEIQKAKTQSVTFDVSMHCDGCKAKIEKNISWEKGVKDLSVDLENKQVTIKYDPSKTTEAALRAAVEKLGYTCDKADEKTAAKKERGK